MIGDGKDYIIYKKQGGVSIMKFKKIIPAVLVCIMVLSFMQPISAMANYADEQSVEATNEAVLPPQVVFMNDRNQNWIDDLNQFKDAILSNHPRFWDEQVIFIPRGLGSDEAVFMAWNEHPVNIAISEAFIAHMDELIYSVPTASDFEIMTGIRQAVALLADGHFNLHWPTAFDYYGVPFEFRWFGSVLDGGFYLIETIEEHAVYLNSRLTYIDQTSMVYVMDAFSTIMSLENIYGAMAYMPSELINPTTLHALGLAHNGLTTFTFQSASGEQHDVVIDHRTLVHVPLDVEALIANAPDDADFYDIFPEIESVEFIHGRNEGELPPFLQYLGKNFFEVLEDGILYIRLEAMIAVDSWDVVFDEDGNAVISHDEDNFTIIPAEDVMYYSALFQDIEYMVVVRPEGFAVPDDMVDEEEIHDFRRFSWVTNPIIVELIESGEVTSVIVDFRGNSGGDPGMFYGLFNFLGTALPEGRLFTFFDQGSFSAATMAPNYLEYFGAISLGMPLSQNVIFHGFGGGVNEDIVSHHELRHSGIFLSIPDALSHIDEPWARIDLLGITLESFIEMFPLIEFYTIRPDIQIYHTIEHWINNYDPLLSHVRELLAS